MSFEALRGIVAVAMSLSPPAQADLFDDTDENHGPSLRQAWARPRAWRRIDRLA